MTIFVLFLTSRYFNIVFNMKEDRLLSSFMEDGTPLLVFGDFNIHLEKPYATDFHSLLASFNLKRLTTTSTHKSVGMHRSDPAASVILRSAFKPCVAFGYYSQTLFKSAQLLRFKTVKRKGSK